MWLVLFEYSNELICVKNKAFYFNWFIPYNITFKNSFNNNFKDTFTNLINNFNNIDNQMFYKTQLQFQWTVILCPK